MGSTEWGCFFFTKPRADLLMSVLSFGRLQMAPSENIAPFFMTQQHPNSRLTFLGCQSVSTAQAVLFKPAMFSSFSSELPQSGYKY